MKEKEIRLNALLREYTRQDCCIAFSGGIDSSLLLKLAVEHSREHGTKVYGVTLDTVLHPSVDLKIAKTVAKETGAIHHVIHVNELENKEILQNPQNRCYLCKKDLFQRLIIYAGEVGAVSVIEGTNEDDLHQYRPGIRAVRELGVVSPLAAAGFTKEEVRALAARYGISVAQRPSTPCLATRLPYDTPIDLELLRKIEAGENALRHLGYGNIRIRVHADIARLEIDERDFLHCIKVKHTILSCLKKLGFRYITLDLEGFRSGSMDY